MNELTPEEQERALLVEGLEQARASIAPPPSGVPSIKAETGAPSSALSSADGAIHKSGDATVLPLARTAGVYAHVWSPLAVEVLCSAFGEERTTSWLRLICRNLGIAEALSALIKPRVENQPELDPDFWD